MAAEMKTFMLMAALTALFVCMGMLMGGPQGALMAFGVAAVMNLFAYWNSDKIVLRLYRARQVDAGSAPHLYQTVAQLAARANLPMPKVYLIDTDQPNAFATGRNPQNAAVAATTGLLKILTPDEVAGVMAHELAHVKNRDTLTMTVTATIAGAISMLANMAFLFRGQNGRGAHPLAILATVILAPLAASLVQMAISRTREYDADQDGAVISGNPLALARALQKISDAVVPNNTAERNPATAHMFIINPLYMHKIDGLFSTHPKTAERVRRLNDLAQKMMTPALDNADAFATDQTMFNNPWDSAK